MTLNEPPPPDLKSLTSVFFAIHLAGGHIGLPILITTFCISKTAKRHPTVINFCVVWILYSIIYCLLIYGGEDWLENPPHALCLTQAAMNYAAPPMAVVAGLQVVLQIWSTFVEPWKEARLANIPQWLKMAAIILPPYLTFIAFAIPAAYVGHQDPHLVQVKNGLYCGLMHGQFEMYAVPIFCGIFLLLIIGFELATIVRIIRGRQIIKRDFPLCSAKRPSLSPWCRAALFLIYAALALGACIMDLKQDPSIFGYMIQAALPLAAFLVFGLQKDVALTWFYWNRKPRWDPDDKIRASVDSQRVVRSLSIISTSTIESTTPIATHAAFSFV
ncbi:hypothetical protein C8T65DRAFT_634467 [Cerioporus squamosus]|nr:hypothetical protein C8T65DRAFT_634467 [Cerioporus squamosus]